ncbi:MAG: sodium:solute symporter [Opitutaceae bacterium]|nr:sodium:solute symporter [Opitutaceae bacterium]
MFPLLRRGGALLIASLIFALTAHAEGLIALTSEEVQPATAKLLASPVAETALPALDGPALGLTPVNHIEQNGAIWLLARDADGQPAWLKHSKNGWERMSPPPMPVRAEIKPSGQAHVLALSPEHNGTISLLSYHTVTDAWADLGPSPVNGELTQVQSATDGYLLTARDATGAETTSHLKIEVSKRLLKPIDWVIITVYLLFTAVIGYYYYRKDKLTKSSADFFVGGRSIPWWAAGVSLYATGTSAISYIATPAKSFATNWLYLANNVVGMVGTIFVAIWIVPLIRRLSLMSVYHYLEMRFHPHIRVLASALAIVLQLGGRMSIVLFLPSLAMSAVTGMDVNTSILIMGLVTIVYTAMGGMKAVIWTDFIQVVVMLGGAFVALGFVFSNLEGGIGDFFRVAAANNKFETFDWDLNLTQATVWGFIILNILGVLVYPQDQVMMQRVLSTKSDKEAGWSIWTLALIIIPGNLTFFGIGTALYVFYKQHPENLNPLLSIDSTFPQFIAAELPPGITGLIIAGIFAASMSTLSSCINSVATLVSVDFYERYAKKATPEKSLRLAEIVTVVGGLIGIGTALLLAAADIKSALDTSFVLGGLLGGGFAGCYALGMFTKRANWQGAFIGVGASLVLTLSAWVMNLVHPFFYIVIANLTTITVGYLASHLFPAPTQSLLGLTIYTPRSKPVAGGR